MAITDLLVGLLERTGLKTPQWKKFQQMEQSLLNKRALNEERLDELKRQIGLIESRALAKKRAFDTAKGTTKRIVGGEIERLFKQLDQCRGQETILARNLDQIALGLSKLAEIRAAMDAGVDEDLFDELAVELRDIFGEMKAVDQAMTEINAIRYEPPETDLSDTETRIVQLEAEITGKPIPTATNIERDTEEISLSSLGRMQELESEE